MRSLDKDATLGNVLQLLDEHCCTVMTFNTLRKELSLEYVCHNRFKYSRQSIPTEFNRSMWSRWSGITSMKALTPSINECWPTKLMVKILYLFWIAPSRPRAGKTGRSQISPTPENHYHSGLNVTHSHSQGNLFSSRKLKDSCTFTAQFSVVEDYETEEDSGPKPNGEKEAESSAKEDTGLSGEVDIADQSLGYISQFANAVELSRKKNCNCFRCGNPDHLVKNCPKDLGKNCKEGRFKLEEGDGKEGRLDLSEVDGCHTGYPGLLPEHKDVSERWAICLTEWIKDIPPTGRMLSGTLP